MQLPCENPQNLQKRTFTFIIIFRSCGKCKETTRLAKAT